MKIVLISNLLSPHQFPLCEVLSNQRNISEFFFLESIHDTGNLPVGWRFSDEKPPYVISYEQYLAQKECFDEKILNADVVIIGSASDKFIIQRLKKGRLTFKYSERFYKTPFGIKNVLRRVIGSYLHHGRFQKYPLYMLAASAYTASDAALFGNYKGKCYRWGYFPECRTYEDIKGLIASKEPASILWAGRMIGWKHPETAILVAKRLKENGCSFRLNLIGTGHMEKQLEQMIAEYQLSDCVKMLGVKSPAQVREYMEASRIYLFTSNQEEGWGAVLNESMNSGCAVVANSQIGSVPFLMKDQENGLVYSGNDVDAVYDRVKYLLDHPETGASLGEKAYLTVKNEWSPEIAARRLMQLCEEIKERGQCDLFGEGPCSRV